MAAGDWLRFAESLPLSGPQAGHARLPSKAKAPPQSYSTGIFLRSWLRSGSLLRSLNMQFFHLRVAPFWNPTHRCLMGSTLCDRLKPAGPPTCGDMHAALPLQKLPYARFWTRNFPFSCQRALRQGRESPCPTRRLHKVYNNNYGMSIRYAGNTLHAGTPCPPRDRLRPRTRHLALPPAWSLVPSLRGGMPCPGRSAFLCRTAAILAAGPGASRPRLRFTLSAARRTWGRPIGPFRIRH